MQRGYNYILTDGLQWDSLLFISDTRIFCHQLGVGPIPFRVPEHMRSKIFCFRQASYAHLIEDIGDLSRTDNLIAIYMLLQTTAALPPAYH